jgi:hypothetical protein
VDDYFTIVLVLRTRIEAKELEFHD